MTRCVCLLVIFTVGTGCASTEPIAPSDPADRDRVNASARGESVQIILRDGAEVRAESVRVEADSVRFTERDSGERQAVANGRIKRITVDPKQNVGAAIGVGGLFGGFILMGTASGTGSVPAGVRRGFGGAALVGAGLITMVASMVADETDRYRIEDR